MDRRNFIRLTQTGGLGFLFSSPMICLNERTTEPEKIIFRPIDLKQINLTAGKSTPFGWSAICIEPGESITFKTNKKIPDGNLWFRISVAREIWDTKLLHIYIPNTDEQIGIIDIRYSSVLVPYEVEIDKKYIPKINKFGVKVTLESQSALLIFSREATKTKEPEAFLPQTISSQRANGNVDDFLDCFLSINSIQSFGWREGTVLDGLWQIYQEKQNNQALGVIRQHFDHYFDKEQNLRYESSRGEVKFNQIDGIESTIPFATLARINPEHPLLKTVVGGWKVLEERSGMVIDKAMISAEGCYTVAYPMAVIGKVWKDSALKKNAFEQLKHRFVLIHDNQLFLRYHLRGEYTYPNWARGAAWTLLGFSRTISELKEEIEDDEIIKKFEEGVKIAISMQREDGLWGCFMHDKASLPDTSGSAGIATSIIVGINNGFLPEIYRKNAERCWLGLLDYITPDGFLKGVAQDNRGGIQLQESDYRVIAQMGMGLMAQLYAAL